MTSWCASTPTARKALQSRAVPHLEVASTYPKSLNLCTPTSPASSRASCTLWRNPAFPSRSTHPTKAAGGAAIRRYKGNSRTCSSLHRVSGTRPGTAATSSFQTPFRSSRIRLRSASWLTVFRTSFARLEKINPSLMGVNRELLGTGSWVSRILPSSMMWIFGMASSYLDPTLPQTKEKAKTNPHRRGREQDTKFRSRFSSKKYSRKKGGRKREEFQKVHTEKERKGNKEILNSHISQLRVLISRAYPICPIHSTHNEINPGWVWVDQ